MISLRKMPALLLALLVFLGLTILLAGQIGASEVQQAQDTGTLVAYKFEDRDGDGEQDSGEGPLGGVVIGYESESGDSDTDSTAADGTIVWASLPPGVYTLTESLPPDGMVATTPERVVTLEAGETVTATFGNRLLSYLQVCKFEDRNGNGQRDVDELGVLGVSVSYLNEYGETDEGVTSTEGCHAWPRTPVGTYAISEEPIENCEVTTSPYPPEVEVVSGQEVTVELGNRCAGDLIARVFEDADGNGIWGPGEPPLDGVTVEWINEYGETDFDVTDATGILTWPGLPAGVYSVTETVLPGYLPTTPETLVRVVAVGSTAEAEFGQRGNLACVDGYKVDDLHVGLPAWVIRAQLADGTGPVYETSTDGSGYFAFRSLPLGVYRFWEEPQTGWAPVTLPEFEVPVLEPGDDCLRIRFKNKQATPTPPSELPLTHYLPIILKDAADPQDQSRLGRASGSAVAAGLVGSPHATPTDKPGDLGCVVGSKVDDLHVGLPGFVIHLDAKVGSYSDVAVTNGLGDFRFDNVPPGDYTMYEEDQTGWVPVTAAQFDINVEAGEECTEVRFKNRQATPTPTLTPTPTPTPIAGCIDGYKVDTLHVGLPGWVIRAQLADGTGPISTNITDGTGYYRFDGLPLGVYRVWEEMQSGWTPVTPAEFEVTLVDTQCVRTRFKNQQGVPTLPPPPPLACIDGYKVDDLDVGLPGWTIRVQRADGTGPIYTDVTDGSGYYRFEGLALGTYRVWEQLQAGWEPVTSAQFEVSLSVPNICLETRFQNRQATPTPTPPPDIDHILHPKGIAANERTNRVFIASKTSDRLYEVDGSTQAVVRSVSVGSEPFGVAVNSNTNKVYVANYDSDTLSIVSGSTGTVIDTINFAALGYGGPSYVAVDEVQNRVYVTLHADGRMAIINGATDTLITTVAAEAGAFGLDVHPSQQRVFVSNRDTRSILVYNAISLAVTQRLLPGGTPYALAVDRAGNRLYVVLALAGGYPDRVVVYSLSGGNAVFLTIVPVGNGGMDGGTGIAVNRSTGNVFVPNSADNTLSVIRGAAPAVVATLPTGSNPGMVAVNSVTNLVYVSDRNSNTVHVFLDAF